MECSSEFFIFIAIDLEQSSQLLDTNLQQHSYLLAKACWIPYMLFQFVLRNTGNMSCDKCLKAMKLGNEIFLQYYLEQILSANRAKKLSDAELIIKLANSSVEERIFRDAKSEIYILSEEKTSADADGKKWKIDYFKVSEYWHFQILYNSC